MLGASSGFRLQRGGAPVSGPQQSSTFRGAASPSTTPAAAMNRRDLSDIATPRTVSIASPAPVGGGSGTMPTAGAAAAAGAGLSTSSTVVALGSGVVSAQQQQQQQHQHSDSKHGGMLCLHYNPYSDTAVVSPHESSKEVVSALASGLQVRLVVVAGSSTSSSGSGARPAEAPALSSSHPDHHHNHHQNNTSIAVPSFCTYCGCRYPRIAIRRGPAAAAAAAGGGGLDSDVSGGGAWEGVLPKFCTACGRPPPSYVHDQLTMGAHQRRVQANAPPPPQQQKQQQQVTSSSLHHHTKDFDVNNEPARDAWASAILDAAADDGPADIQSVVGEADDLPSVSDTGRSAASRPLPVRQPKRDAVTQTSWTQLHFGFLDGVDPCGVRYVSLSEAVAAAETLHGRAGGGGGDEGYFDTDEQRNPVFTGHQTSSNVQAITHNSGNATKALLTVPRDEWDQRMMVLAVNHALASARAVSKDLASTAGHSASNTSTTSTATTPRTRNATSEIVAMAVEQERRFFGEKLEALRAEAGRLKASLAEVEHEKGAALTALESKLRSEHAAERTQREAHEQRLRVVWDALLQKASNSCRDVVCPPPPQALSSLSTAVVEFSHIDNNATTSYSHMSQQGDTLFMPRSPRTGTAVRRGSGVTDDDAAAAASLRKGYHSKANASGGHNPLKRGSFSSFRLS